MDPHRTPRLPRNRREQFNAPLRLFIESHQPILFVAGQVLLALAPLASLLGWREIDRHASHLAAPDGAQALQDWLLGDNLGDDLGDPLGDPIDEANHSP